MLGGERGRIKKGNGAGCDDRGVRAEGRREAVALVPAPFNWYYTEQFVCRQ